MLEKKSNRLEVKNNMELRAKRNRTYPDVNVGDYVKIFHKKTTAKGKQQVSYFSKENMKFYQLNIKLDNIFIKLMDNGLY